MALLTLDAPDFSRYANVMDKMRAMGGYLTELYEQLIFVTQHLDGENIQADYTGNLATAAALEAAETDAAAEQQAATKALKAEILRVANEITAASASAVEQLNSSLRQWVRTTYTAQSDTASLANTLRSEMTQTAEALTTTFTEELEVVQGDVIQLQTLEVYIRTSSNGLEIGRSDSPLVTTVTNSAFAINVRSGSTLVPVMTITQSSIKFGNFSKFQMGKAGFVMEENGSISFARMEE